MRENKLVVHLSNKYNYICNEICKTEKIKMQLLQTNSRKRIKHQNFNQKKKVSRAEVNKNEKNISDYIFLWICLRY